MQREGSAFGSNMQQVVWQWTAVELCNSYDVRLKIKRSRVQLSAIPLSYNGSGQVVMCLCDTYQDNMVLATWLVVLCSGKGLSITGAK